MATIKITTRIANITITATKIALETEQTKSPLLTKRMTATFRFVDLTTQVKPSLSGCALHRKFSNSVKKSNAFYTTALLLPFNHRLPDIELLIPQ